MGNAIQVDVIRAEQIGKRDVDIETRKEKIFKELNKAINRIRKIPDSQLRNGEWSRDLSTSLSVIFETYSAIKILPLQYDLIWNYQREAGQQLSKSKSTSVLCKVIMEGLKIGYKNKEGTDTHQFKVISESLLSLVNYSGCTPEVTNDIAAEPDFLETLKRILLTVLPAHMQGEKKDDDDEKVMEWCLSIYYKTSIVADNITRLCHLEIVPLFSSILDAKVEIFCLTALSTLANIIDEKENTEILQKKPDVIKFLLRKFGLALEDTHHMDLGWSAQECARTLRRLARNNANKKLLVHLGCLPHLVKLAKIGNMKEQRGAVKTIQILALEKENHSNILCNTKLNIIDLLIEISENSSDKKVRNAVLITFWNLREDLKKMDKYKHIVSSLEQKNSSAAAVIQSEASPGPPVNVRKGHIMISYQEDDQVLIKIRDILKDDYVVCMNNDNSIPVMAKAVEEAHVILMCMSRKYKNDPSCQAEAEYAFAKKKNIIPLKMESDYKPDGWLGFIVGSKLFFDFSGKYPFEEKIKELIREIEYCYRDKDAEPKVIPI